MKKWITPFMVTAGLTIMSACGAGTDNSDDTPSTTTNEPTPDIHQENTSDSTENTNGDNSPQTDDRFSFEKFDLDVEYGDGESFEVDYAEKNNGQIEADWEDERNNESLTDVEAMEKIKPVFDSFSFNEESSETEVINEVVDGFELNNDYTDFELEIDFPNNTEKEYEDHNN